MYESEGALWLRTTTFGDDKDRVLRALDRRADLLRRRRRLPGGQVPPRLRPRDLRPRRRPSRLHRAAEGRSHRGARARTRTASRCRSCSSCTSSRAATEGEDVQAPRRLRDARRADRAIGVDATRWFMISRSHDSTIDLDLELARQAGPREPGLLRAVRARADRVDPAQRCADGRVEAALARDAPGVALNDSERELIRKLLALPGRGARGGRAARAAPDRRATRSSSGRRSPPSTATRRCSRSPTRRCSRFRIALCVASRRTLAAALGLLGVSAPESM